MPEMITRVAQALADNLQAALPDGVALDYEYAARAAIEAMREPTVDMLLRGQHAQVSAIRESHVEGVSVDLLSKLAAVDPDHLSRAYRAMINSAMSAAPSRCECGMGRAHMGACSSGEINP